MPVVCVVSTFENLLNEHEEGKKPQSLTERNTNYVCQKLRIFLRRKITEKEKHRQQHKQNQMKNSHYT